MFIVVRYSQPINFPRSVMANADACALHRTRTPLSGTKLLHISMKGNNFSYGEKHPRFKANFYNHIYRWQTCIGFPISCKFAYR